MPPGIEEYAIAGQEEELAVQGFTDDTLRSAQPVPAPALGFLGRDASERARNCFPMGHRFAKGARVRLRHTPTGIDDANIEETLLRVVLGENPPGVLPAVLEDVPDEFADGVEDGVVRTGDVARQTTDEVVESALERLARLYAGLLEEADWDGVCTDRNISCPIDPRREVDVPEVLRDPRLLGSGVGSAMFVEVCTKREEHQRVGPDAILEVEGHCLTTETSKRRMERDQLVAQAITSWAMNMS